MNKKKYWILSTLVLLSLFILSSLLFSSCLRFCDATGNINVFLDENGNGKRDTNEPPMEGVCVWTGRKDSSSNWIKECSYTDNKGNWRVALFPGACCDQIVNRIIPPEGYILTTPDVQMGCMVEFGVLEK